MEQTGFRRDDAGDRTHDSRNHHADRAGRAGGPRLLSDTSRSAEMNLLKWFGLHHRPEGQGDTPRKQRPGTERGPAEV